MVCVKLFSVKDLPFIKYTILSTSALLGEYTSIIDLSGSIAYSIHLLFFKALRTAFWQQRSFSVLAGFVSFLHASERSPSRIPIMTLAIAIDTHPTPMLALVVYDTVKVPTVIIQNSPSHRGNFPIK